MSISPVLKHIKISSNPFLIFPFKVTEAGTFDFIWVEDGGTEYTASKKIIIA